MSNNEHNKRLPFPFMFVDYRDLMPGTNHKRLDVDEQQRLKDLSDKLKDFAVKQGIKFVTVKGDKS